MTQRVIRKARHRNCRERSEEEVVAQNVIESTVTGVELGVADSGTVEKRIEATLSVSPVLRKMAP